MGHGHAFYALVLKLFLVLVLTPVALCEDVGSSHSQPGSSSSSSGSSNSPSQSFSSSLTSSSVANASAQTTPVVSHTHRSKSSTSDTPSSSTSVLAVTFGGPTTTALTSPPLDSPPQTATSPPTDPSVPAGDPPPAPSSSSANEVLGASAKSNHQVPIIAGVVAPVVLIAFVVVAWLFYRRHQRVRDRREWERTHASIADAVRQVASPGPIGRLTPGAQWGRMDLVSRTGTYSDGEDTHRSGDTITNPFVDSPVAHQHAGYAARPPIQVLHSPTSAPQYSGPFDEADDDEYAPQAR